MKTKTYNVFTFDELSETARNRAIDDCIVTWMECESLVHPDAMDGYNKAIEVSERLQTPWFCGGYIWDYCQEQVESDCRQCWYLENGEFDSWIEEE